MSRSLTILGIESSCDDTAAAVLRIDGSQTDIKSSVVTGQDELHRAFGGVVPEIAARAHAEKLDVATEAALTNAAVTLNSIDAIAVTAGPGLIGGVLAGVQFAKGLAVGSGRPLIGVNHLAGHALTPRMTDAIDYPYLVLLVSGGHCQFILVEGPRDFSRLGGTIDDAPGEAFDKVARSLSLSQPGGPAVEREAGNGDPVRFDLPRPLLDQPGANMSFSGLKTAVLRARDSVMSDNQLHIQDRSDLCASFQRAVSEVLAEKSRRAIQDARQREEITAFAVAGGVAANGEIRAALDRVSEQAGLRFLAPPLRYCTDNAAMIAYAGAELFVSGQIDGSDLGARPRWPLDSKAAGLVGGGRKGPKA